MFFTSGAKGDVIPVSGMWASVNEDKSVSKLTTEIKQAPRRTLVLFLVIFSSKQQHSRRDECEGTYPLDELL